MIQAGYGDRYPRRFPLRLVYNGCGELLSGDARFYSHCGSTSTFYEEGILAAYDVDSNKTQTVLIGDDEDLPF